MLQLERPRSLTALVVDRLRQSSVCGELGLGEQLSESALARQLGVSKMTVREALQQLRNEGLVRIVPLGTGGRAPADARKATCLTL
jgi:DNA-binding GntR family transcriptional regulator